MCEERVAFDLEVGRLNRDGTIKMFSSLFSTEKEKVDQLTN